MATEESNYWLHRISHRMEVSYPLLDRNYLSIGFSDFLLNPEFLENMKNPSLNRWDLFEKENIDLWGKKYRTRNNLWRFLCEFKQGDWVIVPSWSVFSIYEVSGEPQFAGSIDTNGITDWNGKSVYSGGDGDRYLCYSDGSVIDIGFVIPVKMIEKDIPRADYAENPLVSRMKMRQTNADISDLKSHIETALGRYREKKPINIYAESIGRMSEDLKEVIDRFVKPDQFENLIKSYFEKIGADEVTIPSKADGDGIADCDVVARFESIKLLIFCQAKHHTGTTSVTAVEQIAEYIDPKKRKSFCEESDLGYSAIAWVISEADEFENAAIEKATQSNVRLINGAEFRKMVLDAGLSNLDGYTK